MKKVILLLLILNFSSAFSQSVNDYKYVIVPYKFDFVNTPDQYRLSTVTKSLLEKYGFVVFFDTDNIPTEIVDSNCNKLYADLKSEGNFIKTELVLYLKDCKKNTLFSARGSSRSKEFATSYNEALREIGANFNTLNYKYNGNDSVKSEQGLSVPTSTSQTKLGSLNQQTLFAQPLTNGFQLVDGTPKIVMKIFNTNSKEVFIAEQGQRKGTLYNKNDVWTFAYYNGDTLVIETYNIKF